MSSTPVAPPLDVPKPVTPAAVEKPRSLPPIVSNLADAVQGFRNFRASLDLPNPGSSETVGAEVSRNILTSNVAFTGLRAEIAKAFNTSPYFTTSHTFSSGSQITPPYQFQTMFGSDKLFMRGAIDNEGIGQGMLNVAWAPYSVTKFQTQLSQGTTPSMLQVEHDFTGLDYSWNLKAMNPNIAEGVTGIYMGSYLQSITKKLALGIEAVWQKPSPAIGPEDASLSYIARYNAGPWIATANFSSVENKLTATFWKRIAENIEAGVETQLMAGSRMAAGPMMAAGRDCISAIGAKYDFRQGSFRGQIDSHGRVSAYYEKHLNGPFTISFSGELDHFKNAVKIGLGLSVEMAGSDELMAQQQAAMQQQMQQQGLA